MEQASAVVALISAVVAVGVMVLGIYERKRAATDQKKEFDRKANQWQKDFLHKTEQSQRDFERQVEQWRAQFRAERSRAEVSLRQEVYLEQFRARLASYSDVFRILGFVSDVGFDPRALHQNEQGLQATADALFDHLYGQAGLLMQWDTRNRVHAARVKCLAFLESSGDLPEGRQLVRAFFDARRYVRADLEMWDNRTSENLERLVARLGEEDAGS